VTRVAALIVAYFSSEDVAALAENLADKAVTGDVIVDVFVIDNSGDADEAEKLGLVENVTKLLTGRGNLGYGGGMNALAKELEVDGISGNYDWLMICNPDIRLDPGSMPALVAGAERHPEAALFGPRLVGDDGVVYPSARAFPSLRTGVGHALFSNPWPTNPWTIRYHQSRNLSPVEDATVDWVSGALMLARPSAFREIDGFDEGYFMYFEDVDLAVRLGRHGWSSVYVPSSHVVHSGARSTSRSASTMRKVHHRSAQRYLSKRYSAWWLFWLRWSLRFALFVRREFFGGRI
jgi:N-acetylglucosaminyl-diphospho-decaprenol L-rhamnosyltransferase